MKKIKEFEKVLVNVIDNDKNNWVKFYLLLKEIETSEIWKGIARSFSGWVKIFCLKNGINEATVWNKKRAGKFYEEYEKMKFEKGIKVIPISEIKISFESLVLLSKICDKAPTMIENLTEKTLNNELKRDDLREIYKSIRDNKFNYDPGSLDSFRDNKEELKIISCLTNEQWLKEKKEKKYFKSVFEQDKYKAISQFLIYNSPSIIKINILVAENLTTEPGEINLHGIEIKLSEEDFINDIRYFEYAKFVDFVWLAIPKRLLTIAKRYKFEECGILVIEDDDTLRIIQQAKRMKPSNIEKTLISLTLRLLK